MKKLFLFLSLLISAAAIGQQTDANNTTQFNVIRNETQPGANTKDRIASAFQVLNDSKVNRAEVVVATGTNDYLVTANSTLSYTTKFGLRVQFQNANTGAVTINPNGLGVKSVVKASSTGGNVTTALAAGDIKPNQILILNFDGTNFQAFLPNDGSGGGGSTMPGLNLIPTFPNKTTSYTAAAGEEVLTDATSALVAISLPASQTDKTTIGVKMVLGSTNTTTITLLGGATINRTGGVTSTSLSLLGEYKIFQYNAANNIWIIIAEGVSISQLDSRYVNSTLGRVGAPVSGVTSGRSLIAIGDSNTFGIGTTTPSTDNFPKQFANLMNVGYTGTGVSGVTAQTWAASNLGTTPTYNATIHIALNIELGINDGLAARTSGQFNTDMTTIVNDALGKGWPAAAIFINSIPGACSSCSSFQAAYNGVLSTLATTKGAKYIDIYTPYFASSIPGQAFYQAGDNLHFNTIGAQTAAVIAYGQVKTPFPISTQALVVNGETDIQGVFKSYNSPFIRKGFILGVDSTGSIGILNSLRSGTRADGDFFIGGNIKQSGAILPTGFGVNRDWLMRADGILWSTFTNQIIGYLRLMDSSGNTTFGNTFNNGQIIFTNSGGVVGGFSNTLILQPDNNVEFTYNKYMQAFTGAVYGKIKLMDGSGITSFENSFNGGGYLWLGNSGSGNNSSKTLLRMTNTAITTDLPYTSTSTIAASNFSGSSSNTNTGDIQTVTTAGGTTVYTLTPTTALAAYATGNEYKIIMNATNTGASTINISGLGAKTMVKSAATALAAGDLLIGQLYKIVYDGTNFQVVNFGAVPTGSGGQVQATSPTLVTPTIGVASATSVNKVAITAPATSATLTLAQGSTLQQTGAFALNLTVTAATTPTFPTGTITVQDLATSQTVTNKTIGDKLRGTVAANSGFGTQALTAGTATVSNTSVTAASLIFVTSVVDGGTPGFVRVTARSAGVSFTITSSSGTDTSTIAYIIIN
jgi:lysophospholipase L1-like esterase